MTDFVRQAEPYIEVSYWRDFVFRHYEYAGYGFPCDADGNVEREALPESARANFDRCLSRDADVVDRGVRVEERRWIIPAAIRCRCGHGEVELGGFTNTCDRCGRDYNWNGDLLAPRDQWGEETGESVAEILRIP